MMHAVASIRKEIDIDASSADVWEAVRDVGNAHTRLFPGVLTDARMDGDARIVTFANGLVARETIVDIDDAAMRLAYSASGGTLTYHHATFQVFENGDGSRVVWIIDLLPNDRRSAIDALMDAGSVAMRVRLGGAKS
jgi:carbon monoxide dehydrogenase subunit G